jgi:hypothetical protein
MSIALDPLSLMRPPAPPASPDQSEPPPAAAPPPSPQPSPSPREEQEPKPPLTAASPGPSLDLGIGATGSLGSAPAAAVGATGFAGVRFRGVSLAIGGRADAPASRATGEGDVRTSLLAGWLSGCAHGGILFGCGVLTVGSLRASADVPAPTSQSSLFFGVGPRAGVLVPVTTAIDVGATGEALFLLSPYTLRIDTRPVYSSSVVSATLTLLAVAHFR